MSPQKHPIVGRMQGLWPHQLARIDMHGMRRGGDLGHIDPTRRNAVLLGGPDWAAEALARIDEIRFQNHNRELAALKKRNRKTELQTRIVEGPRDPWRDSAHGPMRELILTANKDFFGADLDGFFGAGPGLEERFQTLALDWLTATFGDDLIHVRADCDEAAYHLHAVILPLAATKDGRTMLQPSKHAVIADYERFQDEIGLAFAPLGLVRGERRAQAIREARARGETPPPRRRHVRTRVWREQEERRLARERAALEAAQADQQRRAAAAAAAMAAEREAVAEARARQQQAAAQAEAAMVAERAQLARQAVEQDAVLAAAEALGAGLIDPAQDAITLAPAADDPAAAPILARIHCAPAGWQRFKAALTPGWQRMRQAARHEAEALLAAEKAQVARDRAEIDTVWTTLGAVARHLTPDAAPLRTARDQVARVLARWRVIQDRDARRGDPGQTRD